MVGRLGSLSQGIEDGRASHGNGGLFMTRQMSNWRLVEASSNVDVHSVGDFICHLGRICGKRMGCLVVPGRCK